MLALMGRPLVLTVGAGAVGIPVVLALWWALGHHRGPGSATVLWILVALSQVLAVGGVLLWVNRSFAFYTSWDDLLGHDGAGTQPIVRQAAPGHSRTTVLRVPTGAGTTVQALVWLPPQYDEPAYAHRRFPVVVFLPSQPSTPESSYQHFQIGQLALAEIEAGTVPPFVVVMPPLMVDPPRDTECTDVPGGPQAETFLTSQVPRAIQHSLRVLPPGRAWSVMGFSTGGFCAAKIGLAQPGRWGSIAAFGAYYTPLTDRTTGDLFHGDQRLRERNSPLWLYEHHGLRGTRLLMVAGRQDDESGPMTEQMVAATRGDPGASHVLFATGGHNFPNYRAYLGAALRWADLPEPR